MEIVSWLAMEKESKFMRAKQREQVKEADRNRELVSK